MAINITDFDKIWASTSPLTPYSFTDNNYKQGWNFVGATPPARQMWDSYMKWSDEKQQYIVNNFLPLSGGTMTGQISMNGSTFNLGANSSDDGRIYNISNYLRLVGGNSTSSGSWIDVGSSSSAVSGITLNASDGNGTTKTLKAESNGDLTWGGLLISNLLSAKSLVDADLNTIGVTGFYYVSGSGSVNIPEGSNGILLVIDRDGNQTSVKQFYSRWGTQGSNDGNLYVREGNVATNSFGHWWKLTGTAV